MSATRLVLVVVIVVLLVPLFLVVVVAVLLLSNYFCYLTNQPSTQCYENERENNYVMKILGKTFQAPIINRTHNLNLPVISLDALNTELWMTHMVSRSRAWVIGLKTSHLASTLATNHVSNTLNYLHLASTLNKLSVVYTYRFSESANHPML